jgi:hypothetical protein
MGLFFWLDGKSWVIKKSVYGPFRDDAKIADFVEKVRI